MAYRLPAAFGCALLLASALAPVTAADFPTLDVWIAKGTDSSETEDGVDCAGGDFLLVVQSVGWGYDASWQGTCTPGGHWLSLAGSPEAGFYARSPEGSACPYEEIVVGPLGAGTAFDHVDVYGCEGQLQFDRTSARVDAIDVG